MYLQEKKEWFPLAPNIDEMSPPKYTIDQLPGSSQSRGQRHRGEKACGAGMGGGSPAEAGLQ